MPILSLKLGNFDFAVISEGELTIIELTDKLEGKNNLDLDQIQGLAFKKDSEIIITPPRPLIENLDSLPFPARHLLPMEKYFDVFSRQKHFATIIATRGCPFNCTFCYHTLGEKYRIRSIDNVMKEIKIAIEKYNINCLEIYDDLFSVDKKRIYEFCDKIKKIVVTIRIK